MAYAWLYNVGVYLHQTWRLPTAPPFGVSCSQLDSLYPNGLETSRTVAFQHHLACSRSDVPPVVPNSLNGLQRMMSLDPKKVALTNVGLVTFFELSVLVYDLETLSTMIGLIVAILELLDLLIGWLIELLGVLGDGPNPPVLEKGLQGHRPPFWERATHELGKLSRIEIEDNARDSSGQDLYNNGQWCEKVKIPKLEEIGLPQIEESWNECFYNGHNHKSVRVQKRVGEGSKRKATKELLKGGKLAKRQARIEDLRKDVPQFDKGRQQ
eukprot:Gb_38085 [translate_table: standard]